MRTVQFNPRKPTICHKSGGIHELANHPIDIRLCHFLRIRKRDGANELRKVAITETERDRTRRNRLPKDTPLASDARRLATRMTDLDNSRRPVFLTRIGVFPPLVYEGLVLLFIGVFGGGCDVEWRSEMVYVDLDVSWPISAIVESTGFECADR